MKRRKFIQCSTLAGAGWLSGALHGQATFSPPATDASRARVVIVGSKSTSADLDPAQVSVLLDRAIEALFLQKSTQVWHRLFSSKDVVGLKVNCLAGRGLSTHQEVVNAVIERLRGVGVPAHQIIVWDRRDRDLEKAGYRIHVGGPAVQCLGNDRAGFADTVYEWGTAASQLPNTLLKCTAVINLPILKDHGIVGMSGALKNFFGAVNNPHKYHMNCGDPYVADVNMLPEIRRKVRLTICDALTAQYEGGPPFMPEFCWKMNSLIAGVDMVALDRVGWKLLDDRRAERGLPSLEQAGRTPSYILTAADDRHRLGIADLEQIDVIKLQVEA